MLFNSLEFLAFFVGIVVVHLATPPRARWALLLAGSYGFYAAWKPAYLVLIAASTLVDYLAARAMEGAPAPAARRRWLAVSLASNLGLLFAFKYFNFFNDAARALAEVLGGRWPLADLDVLLPVGISFYTFQTLSYTIDVYRGERPAERHLGLFALYVSFFPQLVAGPIERSTRLLPQFHEEHPFDLERVRSGLTLMLWGFFKKIVIADRLALYVDAVYDAPGAHAGGPVLLASYFFALQILCDFSGYSDIAIGAARVLGYDLMENFRRPYLAASVREFWSRWHISLSTWFRDYLYIPLGGNRRGRWWVNVLVVFLVSGLWHGAGWTYLVWGALHGAYLVAGRALATPRRALARALLLDRVPRLAHALAVVTTFHLVLLGWVVFRAASLADAGALLGSLASASTPLLAPLEEAGAGASWELGLALALSAGLLALHVLRERVDVLGTLGRRPLLVRWAVYEVLLFGILMVGEFQLAPFLYFQF